VKEQPRSVNEFYVEADRVRRAYASSRLPGRESSAELQDENYRLERIADMLSDLRKLNDGVEDRDQRWKVQQYMVGLARNFIGRPPLERYPDPLKTDDLPPEVKQVMQDHIGRLATTAASVVDPAKSSSDKVEQMQRAQRALLEIGVSQSRAVDSLTQRLLQRGFKPGTVQDWQKRLIMGWPSGD
jgi:hypothetical protein